MESYSGLSGDFEHATVDHAERYAKADLRQGHRTGRVGKRDSPEGRVELVADAVLEQELGIGPRSSDRLAVGVPVLVGPGDGVAVLVLVSDHLATRALRRPGWGGPDIKFLTDANRKVCIV